MPTAASSSDAANSSAHQVGHAAHIQRADSKNPLPGRVRRPIRVAFLGAGSTFCPKLCRDVMMIEGAERGELRLVDVDTDRLQLTAQVVEGIVRDLGREGGWSVQATSDQRQGLAGVEYVICCVEVSGLDCVGFDNDIPLQYGVDQCIGDTIGPGGVFKGLRTGPVIISILRDMVELCPGALLLNYSNPMCMMCLAAGRAFPQVPMVGLCHSVQGTSHLLADYAGVPYEELHWACAGINHLAWFTKLEHNGRDLYEDRLIAQFRADIAAGLREAAEGLAAHDAKHDEGVEQPYEQRDLVRKDMCVHFGAFITESSGHLSEYLPYYRKSDAGRALLRRAYHGGSRFYAGHWPAWRASMDQERRRWVSGEASIELERSWEYASWIIEAIEKNASLRIHGNVMNMPSGSCGEVGKLITNLPGDGCVEVACLVDGNGVQPTRFGSLPPQMAAICSSNMAVFDLAADAIAYRSRVAATHALMLDPLCSAVLTPTEIQSMADEMFAAQAGYLPDYT